MAEIIISSYFENGSGPVTGLNPTVRIWEVTTTGEDLVVGSTCGSGLATDGIMTEMGECGSPVTEQDGFYRYTFSDTIGYAEDKSYVVRVDGGVALATEFRYQTERITPADALSAKFIADSVWDASSNDYPSSSPETMGGRHNATYERVEIIRTVDIPALFMLMDLVRKYNTNRTRIDIATNTLTVYDDDCTTPLRIFRLLDSTSTASVAEVCERTSIDGTVDGTSPSGFTGDDGYPACSSAAP